MSSADGFNSTFISAFFAAVVLFLVCYCSYFFVGGLERVVRHFEVCSSSRASWLRHS